MDIEFEEGLIKFDKELTLLDRLALDFSDVLTDCGVDHVFVAGYVAILFGRSRVSEDIDVLVDEVSKEKFGEIWKELEDDFYCHNTSDFEEAYDDYLREGLAVRFAENDMVIPNVEFKFVSTAQQKKVLEESIVVELNGRKLPIAPIESQIAYKLFLNSKKDIEDAKYLYEIFKGKLDEEKWKEYLDDLDIPVNAVRDLLGF